VTVKVNRGRVMLSADDTNTLYVQGKPPASWQKQSFVDPGFGVSEGSSDPDVLTLVLPSDREVPGIPIGRSVRIVDLDVDSPNDCQFDASWDARVVSPSGRMANASGQAIEAIKVSDDTWIVTGDLKPTTDPQLPRTLVVGAGTGENPDGSMLPDTLRVAWTTPMWGIVRVYVEIIDPATSTTIWEGDADPLVPYWQSGVDQFFSWYWFQARVTVTDKDGRVSQRMVEKFYQCGKPSMLWPQRLYFNIDGTSWKSLPQLLDANTAPNQSTKGLYTFRAEAQMDNKPEKWVAGPTLKDGYGTTTVNFTRTFKNGDTVVCRYVAENEFGRTDTTFNLTVGQGAPPAPAGVVLVEDCGDVEKGA